MVVEYVSLHNHSHHSLLDGFAKMPEYFDAAQKIGLSGLGLSDHGVNSGIYEFMSGAKELGIPLVPGCEMYVAPINPEGAKVQNPVYYGNKGRGAAQYDVSSRGAYLHMTIFAYNDQGLKNLFNLGYESYNVERNYKKPRIDFELLEKYNEGLIVLTGCPSSEISTRFLLGQDKEAYDYAGRLKDVFGKERLFVEVMNHNMSDPLEKILLPKQVELSKKMGLKLIATNDSHYAYKENAPHHEELLCSQSKATMKDKTYDQGGNRFAFDGQEYYLKSGAEMLELFPEDEFPGAISNTLLVAEMAEDIKINYDPDLIPHASIPDNIGEIEFFKTLIQQGYKKRYGKAPKEVKKEAVRRIKLESEVIIASNFVGYFLVVHDYIQHAKKNYSTYSVDGSEILAASVGVGRGSVGGSILAYLLEISELCPIKHDLIFERFLSAGRGATMRITYTDGTTEDLLVSDPKNVLQEDGSIAKKYAHEIKENDKVED